MKHCYYLSFVMLIGCASGHPPVTYPDQVFSDVPVAEDMAAQTAESKKIIEANGSKLETGLTGAFAKAKLPGVVWAIVDREGVVLQGAYGVKDFKSGQKVNPETLFRIGSITKTITSMALLRQRDERRLSLDDPIVQYIPEAATIVYPTKDSPLITIRHLVTHTSGLPENGKLIFWEEGPEVTKADILGAITGVQLQFAPGTGVQYSNLGMALTGMIVESISGIPYREYVKKHIFDPLGMSDVGWNESDLEPGRIARGHAVVAGKVDEWQQSDPWKLGSAECMGGLWATIGDMAKFVSYQLSAWPPRNDSFDSIIRRATLRESHAIQGPVQHGSQLFGINWATYKDPKIGHAVFHGGSTFQYSATAFMSPSRGVGVIMLCNAGAIEQLDKLSSATLRKVVELLPSNIKPSRELLDAVAFVHGAIGAPDKAQIEETFSAALLSHIPATKFVEIFTSMSGLGACDELRLGEVHTPFDGTFIIECKEGAIKIGMSIEKTPPYATTKIEIKSLTADPALIKAAKFVVQSIGGVDKIAIEQQVAKKMLDKISADKLVEVFKSLAPLGTCGEPKIESAESEHKAFFLVECEKGSINLDLGVNQEAPHLINFMRINAAK